VQKKASLFLDKNCILQTVYKGCSNVDGDYWFDVVFMLSVWVIKHESVKYFIKSPFQSTQVLRYSDVQIA
jgi:hypothetical protein